MEKPLVHVKVGRAFEHFIHDVLEALIASGNYSVAMELHARLADNVSAEHAVREVLKHVEISME